jgi:predicted aspartyl protease
MKVFRPAAGLLFVPAMVLAAYPGTPAGPDLVREAGGLFREGNFAEAEALYARARAGDPQSYEALLGLGTIALFKNNLADAERLLKKALALRPDEPAAKKQLALVYYRRDDFARAAPLYRALGAEAAAKKLESFARETPYLIEGKANVCRVPFVHTDPLPVVQVKVGPESVYFLIDTGASEVYLDPEFAKKVNVTEFGSSTGTYGGGLKAQTGHGRVEKVTLGDFAVHNVPVHILSTRRFSGAACGKQVDGILGTVMLSHFIATLDYPGGQLILRRKTAEQLQRVERQVQSARGSAIPFWLAGDHFAVARGQVNGGPPLLFFADTGLAGGGFVCPKSTLKEAGIKPDGPGVEGQGGAGTVKAVPFTVDELSLGPVRGRDIRAFAGVFPEAMEYHEGFRIGGFISHQFFRPYALTLDFTGMRLFLTAEKSAANR